VRDRINDAGAVAVITADEQCRGGKKIPLKPAVDEGIALGGCESIKNVIVFKRTGGACNMVAGRDIWWHDVIAGQSDVCEPEWVEAEHPLFLLYTSGSTGKPKGVQHSTGGYLLHAILTMKWTFDLKPTISSGAPPTSAGSPATPTSPTGRSPAAARRWSSKGMPTYPDAGRFWKMIQDHKVSIFYTAPTAIRSLIKAADTNPEVAPTNYDLSSLRLLGTVGEPINPAAWQWYYDKRRRRSLPDRRYLLADRDRRPHDHAAARRDAAGAGFVHAALPGHPGGHRR
jgi:acetyl-CoA synthetase